MVMKRDQPKGPIGRLNGHLLDYEGQFNKLRQAELSKLPKRKRALK